MNTLSKTGTHPLILIAAVSVSIASLAAAAHFTGLLPAKSEAAPVVAATPIAQPVPAPAPVAIAPAPVTTTAPAPAKKVVVKSAPRPAPVQQARADDWRDDQNFRRVANAPREDSGIDVYPARPMAGNNLPPAPPPVAANICRDCGTVENIREIAAEGQGSGLGAIAGGVLGGLLGNQTGGGNGKKAMTVLGALGGAYAGHQVEKRVRTETQYEITVRFDDGTVRSVTQSSMQWRNGDRVRLSNGQLAAL
ncbi:MAG TPA: glycine zipper 2TM domain-containing protein [Rhodocyclaceae bacterium]|nr:glycine zipper 2TM domain-containing protein [Rhodocyclaceae bacterium]